jgi:hypothetical protein
LVETMSHFCTLILQTIFTHDEKTMPELARLTDQPGCTEAQAAVYAAATGNRRETMQYAFEAVYIRAEGYNRDGEAARHDARQRHIHLMLDEGYKFIRELGGVPPDRGDLIQ